MNRAATKSPAATTVSGNGKPVNDLRAVTVQVMADEAMLRVGLPVHIEGELHESAEALLALPQPFLGLP